MQAESGVTIRSLLRHLIDYGPLSRPDLGAGVGLARATTSTLVNELMRQQLVGEIRTASQGRRGRPSYLLDLDDDHHACVGLEIGVDRVLVAGYSLRGRELTRVEQAVDIGSTNPRALLRQAAATVHEVTGFLERVERHLLGVGVSIPGLVDAASGSVRYAPSLGWRDVALNAGVDTLFPGVEEVLIGNGADFAAVAERRARLRTGLPADSMLYLTGTYGVEAGIIVGDRPWKGARGLAGEVGHVMVDPAGAHCQCGRIGCLKTKAGLATIVQAALAPHGRRRSNVLATAVDEVVARAVDGDQSVIRTIEDAGRWLGRGAAVVCAVLDPRVVVLGGHYARLAPWLLDPAREAFAEAMMVPPGTEMTPMDASTRGPWAAAEGAALSVLLQLTQDPPADGLKG